MSEPTSKYQSQRKNGVNGNGAAPWVPMVDPAAPLSVREVLGVIRRHLWLVALLTLGGGGVAGYMAYTSHTSYRATAVIRLLDARRALSGDLADGPAPSLQARSVDPLLSHLEVLRSRALAADVVDSLPLLRLRAVDFPIGLVRDVDVVSAGRGDTLHLWFRADSFTVRGPAEAVSAPYGTPVEVGDVRFAIRARPHAESGALVVMSRTFAAMALAANLEIRPRQNTDVIDVSYMTSDPRLAQVVVNRVVDVFQTSNAEDAQRLSRRRREFIDTQLHFNDSLLTRARQALSRFRAQQYRASGQLPADGGGLSGLDVRRQELIAEREMYSRLAAQLQQAGPGSDRNALRTLVSLPAVASHVEVSGLYRQLLGYEATRDSLRTSVPDHPQLARLGALIEAAESSVTRAAATALQSLTASLDARIATLDDLRARNAATFQRRTATEAEEAALVEQIDAIQRLGDQLRGEHQRARIAEAIQVGQVEIVDYAALPMVVTGIGLPRLLTFGLLLGLLGGTGGAFLLEHLSTVIRHREQVAETGLTILGVVPHLRGRNGGGRRHSRAVPVIESFRGVRLNLAHAYGAAGPLLVTVTSSGPRDGKSFVSSNLALAFAHAGHRTLLIDGDARKGALHTVVSRERKPGLTDYLMGTAPRERIVQATDGLGSLDFIASGSRTPDAPELLGSAAMTQLVTELRSSYGVIVVDTPPLTAGVDAFALAVATGNLLVVLRLGTTDKDLLEAKLELLSRLPVRILGTVLNDVREGALSRQYSYYVKGYEATFEKGQRGRLLRSAR
jgi:succinoglycan biosynthesis transport protein ExoP